jgi:hypothetical protein
MSAPSNVLLLPIIYMDIRENSALRGFFEILANYQSGVGRFPSTDDLRCNLKTFGRYRGPRAFKGLWCP